MNKIKKYPMPDEDKGTSSRFSKFVGKEDERKEVFREKEIDIKLTKFEYDSDTKKGSFNPTGEVIQETLFPYIPSDEIKSIVKLAQILHRPILLKGEPGCGKTQLAKAVAFEWYGDKYKEHFFEWHIKSTSKAKDGLYEFDHLARIRDAHLASKDDNPKENESHQDDKNITSYRSFGPLGKAFITSTEETPSIVLIDEIDKADIDFPNDLLLELDESRFEIPETKEPISAKHPPVVFITSNDEREMPEAFLRRCLFIYLKFPEKEDLKNIIDAHLPELSRLNKFIDSAIDRFNELRKAINDDVSDNKSVSTSELLDWLKLYDFEGNEQNISEEELTKSLKELTKPLKGTFYYQTLLKTYEGVLREKKDDE